MQETWAFYIAMSILGDVRNNFFYKIGVDFVTKVEMFILLAFNIGVSNFAWAWFWCSLIDQMDLNTHCVPYGTTPLNFEIQKIL